MATRPGSSPLAEGKKVLSALDGLAEAPQQLLQILVSFDEIDFGSVHDKQV